MIERNVPVFGRLFLDRDAIVHAALRAYIESVVAKLPNCLGMPSIEQPFWTGDRNQGAILNQTSGINYEVVAWSETGVVGLAFDGQGPIDQLGLEVDAVTGGPDDVRGAVPGLPEELEDAFVRAVGLLEVGPEHGEKWAGAGFWLLGDRCGGTLFTFESHYDAWGVDRLAMWGKLWNDRLPTLCGKEIHFHSNVPEATPIHEVIDAMTARALQGPTELTADELATLLCAEPDPEKVLDAQRSLQQVGIRWPGSPEPA